MFRGIYQSWDEWNIGQWTPARQQKIAAGWATMSRRGAAFFILTRGLPFAALWYGMFAASEYIADRRFRLPYEFHFGLADLGQFFLTLLVLPSILYFGTRWNIGRIEAARAAGRL